MIPPRPAASPVETLPSGNAPDLFRQGQRYYTLANYTKAVRWLRAAVIKAPDNARYHHWLGKAYGRLAQEVNWFSAISLSRKTLNELRAAVKLDNTYISALQDLMEYYQQAPVFLGGSRKKAESIARRLDHLEAAGVSHKRARKTADSPS
jgi:tetratricopeptide (TPR) repeat protein